MYRSSRVRRAHRIKCLEEGRRWKVQWIEEKITPIERTRLRLECGFTLGVVLFLTACIIAILFMYMCSQTTYCPHESSLEYKHGGRPFCRYQNGTVSAAVIKKCDRYTIWVGIVIGCAAMVVLSCAGYGIVIWQCRDAPRDPFAQPDPPKRHLRPPPLPAVLPPTPRAYPYAISLVQVEKAASLF